MKSFAVCDLVRAALGIGGLVQALLLAMGIAAQEPKVTLTRDVYPTGTEQSIGDERWLTARIVDGLTRAPLPGAEFLLIAESNHPIRGEFWWQMRAVADADGFVRLRADAAASGYQAWNWVAVRAAGYGPAMFFRTHDECVVALAPAETMPVRVVDWLDRPVPGALVGFCGGCGHTPDLSFARTDGNGLALLSGVDPNQRIHDLYVEHQDLDLGYMEGLAWFPGLPPVVFRVEPGVKSVGTLVDAAGQPIAGAYVGSLEHHRGPWTRTAADGSFRLYGAESAIDLHVRHGARRVIFERPAQQPFRLKMPQPNGEEEQFVALPSERPPEPPADADEARVHLTIVDDQGRPLDRGRYRFLGPLPARHEEHGTQDDGDVMTFLPCGRYELVADGDDHVAARQQVVVTAEGNNDFTLRLTPLPSVLVRTEGLPEIGHVELRTTTQTRDITTEVREGRRIGLPDEPLAFLLHGEGGQRRLFATDRSKALVASTVRLPWFPPTRVVGQIVDAEGEPRGAAVALVPVAGRVDGFDPDEDLPVVDTPGAFALATQDEGLAFVVVRRGNGILRHRIVPVILPPRGDDLHVDVGTIVVDGPPRLQLRDASGEMLADPAVGMMRRGWNSVRRWPLVFAVYGDGCWWGPDPLAGDSIVLSERREEAAPDAAIQTAIDLAVHFPLTGEGPWTLQVPAGEVLVEVRSTGKEAEVAATIGGAHVRLDGATLLRRLPPGPHRLFVAAEGHQSAIVDVVVPSTGRAEVKIELPAR
ncbi:MAG: hypothetical protein Q7T30_02900 [Planctomycetota bacterium]|nr:hypothetical protein [Planctomycetota bacterium]